MFVLFVLLLFILCVVLLLQLLQQLLLLLQLLQQLQIISYNYIFYNLQTTTSVSAYKFQLLLQQLLLLTLVPLAVPSLPGPDTVVGLSHRQRTRRWSTWTCARTTSPRARTLVGWSDCASRRVCKRENLLNE